MATVTPTTSRRSVNGSSTLLWSAAATADTIVAFDLAAIEAPCLMASVQISGTFGGATVALTGSNDGVTYFALSDPSDTAISATANAFFELSTGVRYLLPTVSGGSGDAVNITVHAWQASDFR